MRLPDANRFLSILVCAFFAIIGELVLSFPFAFSPGWANGAPGFTLYQAWTIGVSSFLFVFIVTVGVGTAALVAYTLCRFRRTLQFATPVFVGFLAFVSTFAAVFCAFAFRSVYESAFAEWPNGL